MKGRLLVKSLAVSSALVFAVVSGPAAAYDLTNDPDCGAVDVFDPDWDMCVGAYLLEGGENDVTDGDADNIATQILNDDNVFGSDDWTFLEKDATNNSLGFVTTTGIDGGSGSLTIGDFGQDWPIEIAVSFKAGRIFSIFYWSALDGPPGEITWSTNPNGGQQALSHASVYYRNTSTKVAEPATLGLLGLGLLGVGFARRRKTI